MKVIKCATVTAEVFGQQHKYFVPINASIEDVMNALREINDTAHFVDHQFTETSIANYEAHKLYKS